MLKGRRVLGVEDVEREGGGGGWGGGGGGHRGVWGGGRCVCVRVCRRVCVRGRLQVCLEPSLTESGHCSPALKQNKQQTASGLH